MTWEPLEAATIPPAKKNVPRLNGPGLAPVGKSGGAPYLTTVNPPVSFTHAETSWSAVPSPTAAVSASASPLTMRLVPRGQIDALFALGRVFELLALPRLARV